MDSNCLDCNDCTSGPLSSYVFSYQTPCTNCDNQDCGGNIVNSTCVYYAGTPLLCAGINTNDRLDTILAVIDAKICQLTGGVGTIDPYSTYNVGCLAPVTSQKDFVEKISSEYCTLFGNFNSFVNGTYVTDKQNLQTQLTTLNTPNVTNCSSLGFVPTDTIKDTLFKLSAGICSVQGLFDLSGVNWQQCFTLSGAIPTDIPSAFNLLINQICTISSNTAPTLPTFDNTGSCLPGTLTTADTLSQTVIKIKSRLCTTPTFSASNVTSSGCVPINNTDSLETVLTSIITQVGVLSQNSALQFDTTQFTVSQVSSGNPCLGKKISLNAAVSDRYVAATASDTSPSYLVDKLAAGTNITLDSTTVPGKIVVNSSGGTTTSGLVKVSAGDPSPGYLGVKINGSAGSAVNIGVSTNSLTNQVDLIVSVDTNTLAQQILDAIADNPDLKAALCTLISSCPSPCDPPSNVQAIPA